MKTSTKLASISLVTVIVSACGGGGSTTTTTAVPAPTATTPAPAPTGSTPAPATSTPAPASSTPAPSPSGGTTPAPSPAVNNALTGLPSNFNTNGFVSKGTQTFVYANTQYALTIDGTNFQTAPQTQVGPQANFNVIKLLNDKAVFAGGSIAYSDTGDAPFTTVSGLPTGMVAQDVAYGAGRYVAVLQDRNLYPNTIYSSANLASGMTAASITQLVSWITVAYGNGRFVAMSGSGGQISTSSDGQSWTTPVTVPNMGNIQKLAYASAMSGGLFVASANTGKLYTSPDGSTWTLRDSFLSANLTRIHCIPTHCVAAAAQSNNISIAKSSNGTNWTTTVFSQRPSGSVSVSHDGTRWLVAGDNGILFTSTDGETFTSVTPRNPI